MRLRTTLLVAFLVAGLTAANCGDTSIAVTLSNETTAQLVIYPYGRAYPSSKYTVEAGGSVKTNLLARGGDRTEVASVEAVDSSGSLVFCHTYTLGDLQRSGGMIQVKQGQRDC